MGSTNQTGRSPQRETGREDQPPEGLTVKRGTPRRKARLEAAVEAAVTDAERARAHFELALFHDNNGREAEAIPHYEAALTQGLTGETHAECLAWLSSSLFKTGSPTVALERLREARLATESRQLLKFLAGLERRLRVRLPAP